jgi:hypothetical protein
VSRNYAAVAHWRKDALCRERRIPQEVKARIGIFYQCCSLREGSTRKLDRAIEVTGAHDADENDKVEGGVRGEGKRVLRDHQRGTLLPSHVTPASKQICSRDSARVAPAARCISPSSTAGGDSDSGGWGH